MLCEELPPPPPDVDTTVAHDSGRLDNPSCSGCHIMMDSIGLGLDDFDAIGAYAPGAAIEQGWVEGLGDAGKFTGAAGLAEVLAQHDPVYECFTTELFRYAMRRATADEDACTLDELRAAFSTDDGDIAELIVHIATADFY
jgi:hypothetical protein